MNKLDCFKNILHENFVVSDLILEEKKAGMEINIKKNRCSVLIFKPDTALGKEYKGGLFPFLQKAKHVHKVCDYIVFAFKDNKIIALVIELKKGNNNPKSQLEAGECLTDFIISTVNRLEKSDLKCQKSLIAIHEFKRKRKTKMSKLKKDENGIYQFKDNMLWLNSFFS